MKAKDSTFSPRILVVSIQDTTVPGMVSGMALGGALAQNGFSFTHVYGDFKSKETLSAINKTLVLCSQRQAEEFQIKNIIKELQNLHVIEFGSLSLQMPTTRINQEELAARWGITSENLDQQVFLDSAFEMFEWTGVPGKSKIKKIKNTFVKKCVETIYDKSPDKFNVIKGRKTSRDKYALQIAIYLAVKEICESKGASGVTIKCQDECSGKYATCCMATSFMGNETDMLGFSKAIIPASCETDMPTLYSQYLLYKISGKPSGFGDFRYVKTDKSGKTLLAIVNCGQHPLYYAGKEKDTIKTKLALVEYPGQEHFYAAGGSSVRMRTSGKQIITVARLGVEKGRLYLAATVMNTIDVPISRHSKYNQSWPIIEGYVPVTDKVLGREWPSNHLGFVYGNYIPSLIELAERMGIGYKIWDNEGTLHYKAS
jgi:L-fucose isomerase-like protein